MDKVTIKTSGGVYVPCIYTHVPGERYRVSRFGLAVRRQAGKQRDHGSNLLGSPFSSQVVVCGQCLVTLSLTIMKH